MHSAKGYSLWLDALGPATSSMADGGGWTEVNSKQKKQERHKRRQKEHERQRQKMYEQEDERYEPPTSPVRFGPQAALAMTPSVS